MQLLSPTGSICKTPSRSAVRAELIGSNTCTANDVTACGHAPVLILCRELIAAGCDPDRALEVYRGATLALRVRSIGAAAKLDVNSKGTGFIRHRPAVRRGPPVRQNLTTGAAPL
jgi:hypothetical protein